jgi:phage-related tail fiber protein
MTTPTTVPIRLKLRQDTAANWTSVNPTLLAGELGRESDTGKIKIGTGSAAWTALAYMPGSQDGTTAQKGAVQLEDSTSSTSTTKAATPASVKAAYDLANAALPKAGGVLTGDVTLDNQFDLRFREATANGTNYVGFQGAASIAADVTFTLPAADGTVGQVLSTNGSGTLSFSTPAGGGVSLGLVIALS